MKFVLVEKDFREQIFVRIPFVKCAFREIRFVKVTVNRIWDLTNNLRESEGEREIGCRTTDIRKI